MNQCCWSLGWRLGDICITTAINNGLAPNSKVRLVNDDDSVQPEYEVVSTTSDYSPGSYHWLYNEKLAKYEGDVQQYTFRDAKSRDDYLMFLISKGYCDKGLYALKGNIVVIYPSEKMYYCFRTKADAEEHTLSKGYWVQYLTIADIPVVQPVPVVQGQAALTGLAGLRASITTQPQVQTPITETIVPKIIKKDDSMTVPKVKLERTKKLQIDAAKIAAKIEIGKVANTQLTKRIMKQIDLPPFLIGYKKQIEPVVRLLVANGALIAADSMGISNKKAEFIMEAMQLAGTQEVLSLINLDETIDTLIGMIDPKLMVRAGINDESEDEAA